MNFGKTVSELRKQKNVTQEEMAAQLGVTAAAVSKWENNYTLPDILMLVALADYFQVTTDELLGRVKQWRYCVIAAETLELGHQIEAIAREHGIAAKEIYTAFPEAEAAAREDQNIICIIAGFHSGFYGTEEPDLHILSSVAPAEEMILEGIRRYIGTIPAK